MGEKVLERCGEGCCWWLLSSEGVQEPIVVAPGCMVGVREEGCWEDEFCCVRVWGCGSGKRYCCGCVVVVPDLFPEGEYLIDYRALQMNAAFIPFFPADVAAW